jgi:hypothetical protein
VLTEMRDLYQAVKQGPIPYLKRSRMFGILSWADSSESKSQSCDGVCAGNWTRSEKKRNFHLKRRNLAEKLMGHFNVETALASVPKSATKRAEREVHVADEAME